MGYVCLNSQHSLNFFSASYGWCSQLIRNKGWVRICGARYVPILPFLQTFPDSYQAVPIHSAFAWWCWSVLTGLETMAAPKAYIISHTHKKLAWQFRKAMALVSWFGKRMPCHKPPLGISVSDASCTSVGTKKSPWDWFDAVILLHFHTPPHPEMNSESRESALPDALLWPGEREADTEVGVLVPTQWAVPAAAMAHSSTCHYLQGRALPTRKHCPARACRGEAATALLGISLSLT